MGEVEGGEKQGRSSNCGNPSSAAEIQRAVLSGKHYSTKARLSPASGTQTGGDCDLSHFSMVVFTYLQHCEAGRRYGSCICPDTAIFLPAHGPTTYILAYTLTVLADFPLIVSGDQAKYLCEVGGFFFSLL